jgi:DNA-binding MarR family transcriptional regulator
MPKINRKQALSTLSLEVFRLTARLNMLGDRLARHAGLSTARWQLLGAIDASADAESVAELARRMGLQRQSVQRTADTLADQGFIEYIPNPNHQRAKLTVLTEAGREALDTIHILRDQWADGIKDQLELGSLIKATETLIKLRALLDAENNGAD